jgi:hypothetical protein
MVNWTKVAQSALRGLASALQTVAPYVAALGVALSIFYSPKIIGGIVNMIAWLGRLAVQAIATGAAMLAANPVGALVLAFGAAVAAAVAFRKELANLLGVDVVQKIQDGANWIIGAFVGGFQGIQKVWSSLPSVLADVVTQTANKVIDGIEWMVNKAIAALRSVVEFANKIPGVNLSGPGDIKLDRLGNPNKGAAASAVATVGDSIAAAQNENYVGKGLALVKEGASNAAAAVMRLADSFTGVSKSAQREINRAKSELEDLRMSVLNEAQREQAEYAAKQTRLTDFLNMKIVSESEYNDLSNSLAAQHATRMIELNEQVARNERELATQRVTQALGVAGQLTGALSQLFEDNKAFAIANVVVSTAESIMKTYAQYGWSPLGIAAAAAAAIAGVAQIRAITSAKPGGGSAPSAKGGSTPAASSTPAAVPRQSVTLQLIGDNFSRAQVESLFKQFNAFAQDGGRLNPIILTK